MLKQFFLLKQLYVFQPLQQKIVPNNCTLSKKEQFTSRKVCLWHGTLAGNLISVSIILCTKLLFVIKRLFDIWPSTKIFVRQVVDITIVICIVTSQFS